MLGDRREPAAAMDENRHPPLGGEGEDGGEPRVVEPKGLSPWVELDPARARIQRAGRFLDRLLREVEPGERDEYAARFPRRLERAVVGRPEGRLTVGLVQAEGERARDA